MSPRLDTPLNRREALTSLLAMLAFVMGVGGAIDEADADSEVPTESAKTLPRTDYALDGIVVAHDGDLEVNAEIRIEDAAISIRHRGSNKVRTIHAQKPAAIAFVDTLAAELLSGTSKAVSPSWPPAAHPQPSPGSSVTWGAELMMFAGDHHLPIPRNLDLEGRFAFDGHTLRMDLQQEPDEWWVDGVEQSWIPLGSFVYTGDPATLLDRISVESDRAWLKQQMERADRTTRLCPKCVGVDIEREGVCTHCNGAGRISATREENLRAIKQALAKRQRKINRAIKNAASA